jgi:hypothetical protein
VRRALPSLRSGPTPSATSRMAPRRAAYANADPFPVLKFPVLNPNARPIRSGANHTLRPAPAR